MKRLAFVIVFWVIMIGPGHGDEPVNPLKDLAGASFDISGGELTVTPYEPLALYKVSGVVLEKGSRIPLAHTKIHIRDDQSRNIVQAPATDGKGFFEIGLVAGDYTLIIAASGYEKWEKTIKVPDPMQKDLVIRVIPQVLNPYHVIVRKKKDKPEVSAQSLSVTEAASVPGSGRDVLKSVTSLPGVNSVSVFNGYGKGISIRGSSQEDSLFLVGDHSIPAFYHFGGFESIVEPEMIESMDYNAGGFSAEYGNAMGGVVSMNLRRPRTDRFGGYVNLGLLSSSFMVEGPVGEKDSLSFGMKRGFIDRYIKMAEEVDDERNKDNDGRFLKYPVYYDANFAYCHRIAEGNEMRLTGIGADDTFEYADAETAVAERFSNTTNHRQRFATFIGEWDYKAGDVRSVLSPMVTSSRLTWDQGDRAYFKQNVNAMALNEKAEYRLNDTHRLKGGLRMDYMKVNLDSNSMVQEKEGEISYDHTDLELKINRDFSFFYPTVYLMDQVSLGRFTVTPGFHYFRDTENGHDLMDPRLSVRFRLTPATTLKTALGLYSQMPQYDECLKPWGTEGLEPERSVHAVAGIEHYFTDSLFLDVQAYKKTFSNLVVRESADNPTVYSNSGKGESYGAEIMLRQNMTDRVFGWISYAYAVARRTDGPGKAERYFDMDTPHNLVGVLNYKPNRNWSFGVRYQYVSGTPYTDLLNVNTRYDVDNDIYVPLYTGIVNEDRLTSHQQVDFRIDRYWLFDDCVLSAYLDFRNVFQSKYVTDMAYNPDYTAKEEVLSVDSEIPLIFVGMKIDF